LHQWVGPTDDRQRIKPFQGFSSGGGCRPPVAPAVIHIKPLPRFFTAVTAFHRCRGFSQVMAYNPLLLQFPAGDYSKSTAVVFIFYFSRTVFSERYNNVITYPEDLFSAYFSIIL